MSNFVAKIVLAEPRGFCAGVNRAIEIMNLALDLYGSPLYVRHEIVHNHHVVNDFKKRGVIFVETLDQIPDQATLIFSAHGTSPQIIQEAKNRGLKFIDAVCPLVTKVHLEIIKALKQKKKVIYIGHRNHQEVLGAMGFANNPDDIFLVESIDDVFELKNQIQNHPLVVATQTTLSVDDTRLIMQALSQNFSKIEFPKSDDICYATQNRQDAIKELVKIADHVLIIGSKTSSNTMRLLELALNSGLSAELVPDPLEYNPDKALEGKVIGISSGASAPEFLVNELVARLNPQKIENLTFKTENIEFPLPSELR